MATDLKAQMEKESTGYKIYILLGMLRPICLILVLLTLINFSASSQIKIEVAGKKYVVPAFKDDTVGRPGYLRDISIPEPIEQSKYDIEIRFYTSAMMISFVNTWVIKGTRDSLFAETYEISRFHARIVAKEVIMKSGVKHYLYYQKQTPGQLLDTALTNLITHKLSVIQDQHQVYQHLKEHDIKVNYPTQPNDCCLDVYIEVKIKNHIRSFTYNYYPAAGNLQIQEFAEENLLMNDFDNLIYKLHKLSLLHRD
jgi:hypothetical protein